MSWSWRIGRISNIDLKVHATFLLLLIFIAYQYAPAGAPGVIFGISLTLLIFLCVLLHELGHSVVAQGFGVPVKQIILLPIGGVAMLGRMPKEPRQELLIALAGPVVNVVIAAAIWAGLHLGGRFFHVELASLTRTGLHPSALLLFAQLANINVALAVFNMVPAFPLDGGRVLRAILGFFMPLVRATRIAAGIGQFFALALGAVAFLLHDWLLGIIAIFVYLAAGAERNESQAGTVLATRRVGDAYNRYAITLTLNDRLSNVVDYLLKSYQRDFAVLSRSHQLQGVVTRDDVLRYFTHDSYDVFVTEIMQDPATIPQVQSTQTLDDVRTKLAETQQRIAAVYEGPSFLGLVSLDDIAEAQLILTFLERATGTLPPPQPTVAPNLPNPSAQTHSD